MWDMDLTVLPGTPDADVKRRLLEEWLRNPFLDEDLHLLEQRLGTEQADLRRAIDDLCREGVISSAGARGYMLEAGVASLPDLGPTDLDPGDLDPADLGPADLGAAPATAEGLDAGSPEQPTGEETDSWPAIDMSEGLAALFPGVDLSAQALIESLPFGVVVLRATGGLEMANQKAAQWLGISLADLDAATFELVTGANPLAAASGPPMSFSLAEPSAIEVSLYPATLESGEAVLAVMRDVSLQEEVSHLQAETQEELFTRLSDEMVCPLGLIEQFLNHPSAPALDQARAAMEQINWFLRDFFLRGAPGKDPDEDEPPCTL